ncbi:hypothetical protein CAC42_6308 [Sphaceloma murrayae]|uniref:Uncharacterized protein n=1 Tax=Sphaceloma murrayae TaxID=2082308 RepID=A0A2K1QTY7_9PEZI|nr:hypothetical protein CAC42_6308 [Sphaceloma murrayae]
MFSPTAAHQLFTPLSPNPNALHSPSLSGSPLGGSPYRLPALPRPSSGDLVSGIVDKFNSLSVTDREEEKARYERQIAKLKAALDRASMAREEAETEAAGLRDTLLGLQEERVVEREGFRGRIGELEKKYDKAKDRFKMQRAKNEEAIHVLKTDFMEKEKGHWRNVAMAQEAEEWERKLRIDYQGLLDFVELERRFEAESLRGEQTPGEVAPHQLQMKEDVETAIQEVDVDVDMEKVTVAQDRQSRQATESNAEFTRPTSRGSEAAEDSENERLMAQRSSDSLREVTPEGPPSMPIRPFATPAKQVLRVPVDFGDVEDKENRAPVTVSDALKTPVTIDRAAALAAIEYRRGRARSFMNAQMTPKTLSLADKRDVSAPAMVTMTVGRKR